MEEQKLSIDEIVDVAKESRSVVYDAINAGHLKTFVVGRRRFARPAAVREWVDYLEAESNAGRPVIYRPRCRDWAGASHAPGPETAAHAPRASLSDKVSAKPIRGRSRNQAIAPRRRGQLARHPAREEGAK